MQYVNDDMDELFKRAAENYPLDTKSADWNKVLAALQNGTETNTISEKKGNKKGRFLWLLLLLPLGFICNRLYSPGSLTEEAVSKTDIENNRTSTEGKGDDNNKVQNTVTYNHTTVDNNRVNQASDNQKEPGGKESTVNVSRLSVQTKKESYLLKANEVKKPGYYSAYNNAFSSSPNRNQSNSNNDFIAEEQSSQKNYVSRIVSYKEPLNAFTTSVNRKMNPLFHSTEQELKQNIQVTRRKKFYAGIVGGLDATTVKFQKIENTGFTYGLLFGYQVNRKWSFETGAFLERKYYYSDGKFINTSKIPLPPNTWIDDASGDCKMIEVPISVKYNFSTRKNSGWFGTVGTSSYIMQKENYTYNYYYGTIGPVPHKKEYKNSSANLFSALSISGGYTHRLGNFGEVRIEPYVKLPVSKMGVGKLPFFSTGLQVGVTRKF